MVNNALCLGGTSMPLIWPLHELSRRRRCVCVFELHSNALMKVVILADGIESIWIVNALNRAGFIGGCVGK